MCLNTADALFRDPVPNQEPDSLQEEVETFVNSITRMSLPATEQIRYVLPFTGAGSGLFSSTRVLQNRMAKEITCSTGAYALLESLTICDKLLVYNSSIIVPKWLQKETLQRIHRSSWDREVQKAYLIFCLVASRSPSWYRIARWVPCVPRKADQEKSHWFLITTTEISMPSHRNRPIQVEQKQLLSSSRLFFTVSGCRQIDLNHFS